MLYETHSKFGKIAYDKEIIASIVRRELQGREGRILFSDPRGRVRKNALRETSDDAAFLDVELREDAGQMDITVYLVIYFGTSIKEMAAEITECLRRDVPLVTGFTVGRVSVVVTGVMAKSLVRRRTEVVSYAE
ncbi:MAG: Asp23/Gls24 family envelope stress response protein [Clostridiales Family XIII bacterium]|jgi:uncharacterized alkaline shock family protein YloU|nr:Asp23/Gls24 family envelope stress response protein [Clostridiales Family XIII bacterium]